MVKISIIMPVFNAETFLEVSCESVSNQTLKDIELICIDDGSTDNSLKKLYELKEKYNFIKIYSQKNQGSGKARNYGIDKAIGDYIAFLDADDIFIDDDALEKMYNTGLKYNSEMVCANLKRVSLDGNLEENFNYKDGNYAYFSDFVLIKSTDYGVPWAFYKNIFKTKFLNKHNIRFPDLKRGQDPVFLAEVLVNIKEIPGVPVDLYGYNYDAGGGANSKVDDYTKKLDYIKHFKETFEILEKAGFDTLSNKYKEKLEIYLRLNRNRNDQELQEIVWEVFGNNIYYDNFKEKLFNLKIPNILNNFNKNNFNSEYPFVKNSFYNMSFVDDYFTAYEIMEKYLEFNKQDTETNLPLILINKLNKSLTNENNDLNLRKNKLTNEMEKLNQINRDLEFNVPNIITEDIVNSIFYNELKDLKIEVLSIALNDSNLIDLNLIEEYILVYPQINSKQYNYLEILEKINKKLQIENEYLNKQKYILEKELNKLIK